MNSIYTSSSHSQFIFQPVHIVTKYSLFTPSSPRNEILKMWWVRKYQIIYNLSFDVQLTSVSFFFSAVSSSLSSSWSLETCGSILKYKHKQLLTEFLETSVNVKSCKWNHLVAPFYSLCISSIYTCFRPLQVHHQEETVFIDSQLNRTTNTQRIKVCTKLVSFTRLYSDAWSTEHTV